MKTAMMGFALAVFAASDASAATGLQAQVTQADGWVAWQVPMIADAGAPCCFTWRRGAPAENGCDLAAVQSFPGLKEEDLPVSLGEK